MFCTKCGSRNNDTAKYCKKCGEKMIVAEIDIQDNQRVHRQIKKEKMFPGLLLDSAYLFGPLILVFLGWALIQFLSYFFGVDLFSNFEPNTMGNLISSVLSVVFIITGLVSMLWLVIIYPVIFVNSFVKSGRSPGMKKVLGNNEVFREKEKNDIPDEIKGWSWGGFLWGWIWAIGNKTWIGLLALIPYVGFVMNIILGFNGREWAWKNNNWMSTKQFNRVQRNWAKWWLILILGIGVLGIFAAALLASVDPNEQLNKARDTNNRSTAIELLSASQRYYAMNGYFPWNKSANSNCRNLKNKLVYSDPFTLKVEDQDLEECLSYELISKNKELPDTFFDNLEKGVFRIDISKTTSLRVCYSLQSNNQKESAEAICDNTTGQCFECVE